MAARAFFLRHLTLLSIAFGGLIAWNNVVAGENSFKSDVSVPIRYTERLPLDGQSTSPCLELQMPEEIRMQIAEDLHAECPKIIVSFTRHSPDTKKALAMKIAGDVVTSSISLNGQRPPARSTFLLLLQGSDQTSLYALGCVFSKNSRSGKGSVVRLNVQLQYSESLQTTEEVLEGTARWSYPRVGRWDFVTGAHFKEITKELESQLRP